MEYKLLTADRFVDRELGCSYRYVHSNTEYFRPHRHDYYEIFIVLDGNPVHLVNGERVPMKRGTAVFVRPFDAHHYVFSKGEVFHMLNITFTVETAEAIFACLGEGFDRARLVGALLPPTVELSEYELRHIHMQMASIQAIGEGEIAARKTALRIFLFQLIAAHFHQAAVHDSAKAPAWLATLCEELQKNGNFIKGIAAVRELTDKSREHVSRSMKKYYGITVSAYINDLRLNYIANMLQYSDHKILDIVFESGFNNVSWCSTCFLAKYGMTMREYRKQMAAKA